MEPIYIVADTQRTNHQDIKVTQNDSGLQFVIKIQQGGKEVAKTSHYYPTRFTHSQAIVRIEWLFCRRRLES